MNNINDCQINCCGCTACMTICPTKAISFNTDRKGFEVPEVDNEKCIQCGKCLSVCSFWHHKTPDTNYPIATYACKLNDESKRMISRSGGAWIALAELVLSNNGVIYGAMMDENNVVLHTRCTDNKSLFRTQGSKYVQSSLSIRKTYESIINDLDAGRCVLFSGVGCQVGGLLNVLKAKHIDYANLITVDIVCHGVISPKILSEYIEWLNHHHGCCIENFNFRDKSVGWESHFESYVVGSKKYFRKNYTEIFYSGCANREACFECPYAKTERCADFTLADCWGVNNQELEQFNDHKGISMLMINDEKANCYFGKIKNQFSIVAIELKDYLQPQLKNPIERNHKYELFWRQFETRGFKYILNIYGKNGLRFRIKRELKKILNKS